MTTIKDVIFDYKMSVADVNEKLVSGEINDKEANDRLNELFDEAMDNIDNLLKKIIGE